MTLYPTSLHLDFIIAVRRIDCKIFLHYCTKNSGVFLANFIVFAIFANSCSIVFVRGVFLHFTVKWRVIPKFIHRVCIFVQFQPDIFQPGGAKWV